MTELTETERAHVSDARRCMANGWNVSYTTVQGLLDALAAARAEVARDMLVALDTYDPCQGAEEQSAIHAYYCVPFYEWRTALREDLRALAADGGEPDA